MPSALITGANRGLGLEFARQYFADGWRVYAACRDPASASELRRLARAATTNCGSLLWKSLTQPASMRRQLNLTVRLDLLLNNAGIIGPRGQTIGNIDYEAWANVLAVNTMGPMRGSGSICRARGTQRAKAHRHAYERHGVHCRQYVWRLDPLSQLESRGEHGHAQSGNRPRASRHHMRRHQSRLGPDGYGWDERHLRPVRKHKSDETCHRDAWPRAVRQVLQSHRSRISLVACIRCVASNRQALGHSHST